MNRWAKATASTPEPSALDVAALSALALDPLAGRAWAGPVIWPRKASARALSSGPGRQLIADIQDELRARPYELAFVAGGWHHRTRPAYADAIRAAGSVSHEARAPALTATENLVVTAIAYLQPVTRVELSRLLAKR